jgi:hypothetical protein
LYWKAVTESFTMLGCRINKVTTIDMMIFEQRERGIDLGDFLYFMRYITTQMRLMKMMIATGLTEIISSFAKKVLMPNFAKNEFLRTQSKEKTSEEV